MQKISLMRNLLVILRGFISFVRNSPKDAQYPSSFKKTIVRLKISITIDQLLFDHFVPQDGA
jgi:hypothetical protein